MTGINIEDEIREIRAHLNRLQQQRDAEEALGESSELESETLSSENTAPEDKIEEHAQGVSSEIEELLNSLKSNEWVASASIHTKEWLSALNEDLKDTKPTTLLAVFGLGVMVGRLTSK
jgi:hypothetical protein